MGFDPRRWRPSATSRPITTNVEALLAENDSLRREVRSLRLQLELLLQSPQRQSRSASSGEPRSEGGSRHRAARSTAAEPESSRVSHGFNHGLSAALVERWGEALSAHPHWQELRVGQPGGLRELVEELRLQGWNPRLSLEEELDRRSPGLGAELAEALRGPHSRVRWAVRAAFALYGPRAIEWLNEDPLRVVGDLLQRSQRLERRRKGGPRNQRGTRTANHSTADSARSGAWQDGGSSQTAAGSDHQSDRQTHRESDRQTDGKTDRSREQPGASEGRQRTADRQQGPRSGGRQSQSAGHDRGSGSSRDTGRRNGRQRTAAGEAAGSQADPRLEALWLLGLEAGAGPEAIKRAYRQLAKRHHPDLGGDAEAFLRLDAAYRLLL
ncbi:MAG: DnaJ domain-containing protein [Cyanobium sp.]